MEPFLAPQLDQVDQVGFGAGIYLAAAHPRVNKGVQPGPGQGSRAARGHLSVIGHQDALGKIVRFDPVFQGKPLHLRGPCPVPADKPGGHPLVGKAADPALALIPKAAGGGNGQPARGAGGKKTALQRFVNKVRFQNAAAGAQRGNMRPARNEKGCLFGGYKICHNRFPFLAIKATGLPLRGSVAFDF